MLGFIRYQFISYIRSFKIIPPAASFLIWVFVLYSYSGVEILSSYAVTSIAIYTIMTWVSMSIFSIEEETEKNILFVHLSKKNYLWGKWLICILIAIMLMLFAIFYPLLMNSFKETMQPIHFALSVLIHFLLAIFGIIVGSLSSISSFVPKKYTWLFAVFVIVLTLSYEGIVEKLPLLKWLFIVFPPVVNLIYFFEPDSLEQFGVEFWMISAFAIMYTIIGFTVLTKLFLKEES
ncbi:hypothetical protein WAX74_17120 [Psychrobacillus sp. FJAT-51614]|uniref:ABC transporter permease n=1 Tax=Psychrobacillus mangrovi TaxID=3117745 RepID=A0ABU8F8Q7_9BACI